MAKRQYPTLGWVQGEAHVLLIKVTQDGASLPVSGRTFTLWCKRKLDDSTTYLFEKEHADFTQDVDGHDNWISVDITAANLNFSGEAYVITEFDDGSNRSPKGIFRLLLEASPE